MYTSMMVFGNKPAKMVDDMHQTFHVLPLVFICLALVGVLFCAAIPLGYLWQKRSDSRLFMHCFLPLCWGEASEIRLLRT